MTYTPVLIHDDDDLSGVFEHLHEVALQSSELEVFGHNFILNFSLHLFDLVLVTLAFVF